MNDRMKPVAAAFQFLSRFPVKTELDFTSELLKRSTAYYPLVGTAIGLCVLLFGTVLSLALPAEPTAVLMLILWVWLTGGLHLDGWMDTADGLLSYRPRDKMLEIMKDSRVGAMAVIACVLLLLLKFSLLVALLEAEDTYLYPALLTAPVWSRWFMAYAMGKWPSARGGEGLAGRFSGLHNNVILSASVWAFILTGLCVFAPMLFGYGELSWITLFVCFLGQPLVAWVAGTRAANAMSAKLGGLTGDTYGALNEGLEVLLLLIALLVLPL